MRTILVTGTSGGIGGTITDRLLGTGSRVIGLDVQPSGRRHPEFTEFTVDLTNWEDLDRLIEQLSDQVGSGIDGIVHCAGVGQTSTLAHTPRELWERILQINLHATIALVQGLDRLINDSGRIVLFGSGIGIRGNANMFAYAASKGGVMALAKSLAHEFGPRNITVNVVSPGFTRTGMTAEFDHMEESFLAPRALQRAEVPDDLVGITEFLLSENASFITGQTISVDGGSVKL